MLDCQFKIGDRVVINVDEETRGCSRTQYVPEGTEGIIVGKTRQQDYRARVGYKCKKQGVYECDANVIVQWENSLKEEILRQRIKLVDEAEDKRRLKEYRDLVEADCNSRDDILDVLENRVYIGPLPYTKFWEGDKVRIISEGYDGYTGEIIGLDYYRMRENGKGEYSVECFRNGLSTGCQYQSDDTLELIERGDVWKHYHGEPIVYASMEDEIKFAMSLGLYKELRNPLDSNTYSWTLDEALHAVEEGTADGFNVSAGLFGGPSRIAVLRFEDRDLGERVRQETLLVFEDYVYGERKPKKIVSYFTDNKIGYDADNNEYKLITEFNPNHRKYYARAAELVAIGLGARFALWHNKLFVRQLPSELNEKFPLDLRHFWIRLKVLMLSDKVDNTFIQAIEEKGVV